MKSKKIFFILPLVQFTTSIWQYFLTGIVLMIIILSLINILKLIISLINVSVFSNISAFFLGLSPSNSVYGCILKDEKFIAPVVPPTSFTHPTPGCM